MPPLGVCFSLNPSNLQGFTPWATLLLQMSYPLNREKRTLTMKEQVHHGVLAKGFCGENKYLGKKK